MSGGERPSRLSRHRARSQAPTAARQIHASFRCLVDRVGMRKDAYESMRRVRLRDLRLRTAVPDPSQRLQSIWKRVHERFERVRGR